MFIQIMWNFIIYFYPMEDNFTNRMEIFAEITNLCLMYHVMLFTDFVGDPSYRYGIGYSFVGFMGLFIAVHMFLMIKDLFKQCQQSAKKKQKKKADEQAILNKRLERMNKFKRKIARIQEAGEDVDELFEEFGIMMGGDIAQWELSDFDNMNDQIAYMKQARER